MQQKSSPQTRSLRRWTPGHSLNHIHLSTTKMEPHSLNLLHTHLRSCMGRRLLSLCHPPHIHRLCRSLRPYRIQQSHSCHPTLRILMTHIRRSCHHSPCRHSCHRCCEQASLRMGWPGLRPCHHQNSHSARAHPCPCRSCRSHRSPCRSHPCHSRPCRSPSPCPCPATCRPVAGPVCTQPLCPQSLGSFACRPLRRCLRCRTRQSRSRGTRQSQ
mmetsp:Transcript_80789/g.135149  ORF Transcript_80789/g.135149 Transcript_80789/m.135149 type:complete len:214 (-) Transcript_80789:430-1071(-)